MRILHITTEFPPVIYGGLGTAVGGLVTASARSGLDVGVLLIGGALVVGDVVHLPYGKPGPSHQISGEPGQAIAHPSGITFFQLPWNASLASAVQMVEQWQPDVIHLHTVWIWPHARAIRESTRLPFVYTVHSVDRAEYEIGHEPGHILSHCQEQEEAISVADRLIALTGDETELLVHYYPKSEEKIRIIGNGIDDTWRARKALIRKRYDEASLVLYTGRLVERKGIRDLLAAIPRVLERAPRTQFVLAGGPPDRSGEDLKHEWLPPECYPYYEQIHFTGWLSPREIEEWYCRADIQVVPSRYEPFGMVILEGMLYGLPIIAADVGGPSEILEHGRTGLLFPARDVAVLAEDILKLVTNPALCRRIGIAAARDVRNRWLWPQIVMKMQSVYREAARASVPF